MQTGINQTQSDITKSVDKPFIFVVTIYCKRVTHSFNNIDLSSFSRNWSDPAGPAILTTMYSRDVIRSADLLLVLQLVKARNYCTVEGRDER